MLHMPRGPSPLRSPPRRGGWIGLILLVGGFVIWDAVAVSRHLVNVSETYGVTVDAPVKDARRVSGYEQGRRSLVLPSGAADTAHWIMQTQTMIADGDLRLRHVDYDNAPGGREVHWAAPFHWWLALLAYLDHFATGRPLGIAVEYATLTSGPAMLLLFLFAAVPLVWKKFSAGAASLMALGAIAMFPFYTDFLPGRADHHGLANLCGLLTVLLLTIAAREDARARRWMTASAVAGGIGLWISAATQVPVLLGVGCGVLGAAFVTRKSPTTVMWLRDPTLLRRWGWIGGGVSFAAYLIEYFPAHLGWRLEVNHPLYALAWIGAGEALSGAVVAMQSGATQVSRRAAGRALVGAGLVALLPLTIALTSTQTFVVADSFLWQLHTRYIGEFQSLARLFATQGVSWEWVGICLPVLLLLPPALRLVDAHTPRETKALLMVAFAPAALSWCLGAVQIRWLSQAFALTVPLLATFLRPPAASAPENRRAFSPFAWTLAGALLLLPGLIAAVQRTAASGEFSRRELRSLAERDVAHWLRLRADDGRVVVAGSPNSTTKLIALGGLTGLGTLYWENVSGLKNAAALFAAPSADVAHERVRRLGVTHIVLFSWDAFEVAMAKLDRGLPETTPLPSDAFIVSLLGAPVPPPWLRAIPFKLPDHEALRGDQVRIWEVTAEQTPPETVAHAASYYLESGAADIAAKFAPMLVGFKDDLAASVMLAGIAARQRDAQAFSAAIARILAQLRSAENLALDDRVALIGVLAVGQQTNLAREQLQAAMRHVDARNLHALTPGTLSDLLALADALQVDFPDPAMKRLAERLVPPAKRQ